jgi:hypothetical protein
MNNTLIAMLCAAAGTLLMLDAGADDGAAAVVKPVAPPRPPVALSVPSLPSATPPALHLAADSAPDPLKRPPQAAPRRNVFAPQSWAPPPPPPAKVVPPPEMHGPPPPPPPTPPPPLPFAYLGQLDSPGERTVFYLSQGERVHAVSVGDTIDSTYKVEADDGGQLQFTYLPLKARQALALRRTP